MLAPETSDERKDEIAYVSDGIFTGSPRFILHAATIEGVDSGPRSYYEKLYKLYEMTNGDLASPNVVDTDVIELCQIAAEIKFTVFVY